MTTDDRQAAGPARTAAPGGTAPPAAAIRGRTAPGRSGRPGRASRWRAAFFVLALVGILGVTGWALLGSRLLVVRVITVTGTHLVPTARVIAAADVPPGTPLIRVDPAQVAARVEAIQQVASAQVTKDWPDGMSITVHERVAAMAVRMSGGYDLIDPDGVIVVSSASKPARLPLLATTAVGGQLRGDPGVATVAQVLARLPSWLSRQVARVSVREADGPGRTQVAGLAPSVTLYLSGGQTVVWGDGSNSGVKARELAIVMRGRSRYYDLSAPATVITR